MKLSVSYGTGFDLGPWQRDMRKKLVDAASRATDKAALGARDEVRRTMREKRLGGLANAVKMTSDLRKRRVALRPGGGWRVSGVVYPAARNERTRGAIESYAGGATIVPKKGQWLAIPTPDMQRLVRVPLPRSDKNARGNVRTTPDLYRRTIEAKFGPLTFIRGKHSGLAYLVLKGGVTINAHKPGLKPLGKSGRAGRGRAHVGLVAFVLLKRTRRDRRFEPGAIIERWQLRVGRLIQAEMLNG